MGLTYNALTQIQKAACGDMVFTVTPATLTTKATADARTRVVSVALTSADGVIHEWFNTSITSGVSIADTSSAGKAKIASTTLTFIDGVASVTVSCDEAAWVADETDTLTVAQATILGYTVAAKTSVETFEA